jgi:hypothetical protein
MEEWLIEQDHLLPLKKPFTAHLEPISFHVRKDNTIKFKGNYYSLPLGTYTGADTTVLIQQQDDNLIICDGDLVEIARHKISLLKGMNIRNSNHYRNHTNDIDELIQNVSKMFSNQAKATQYMEKIRKESPRYIRDQASIIANICVRYDQQELDRTLQYCFENSIYKATDFEPVLKSLRKQKQETPSTPKNNKSLLQKKYKIVPQTSKIADYNQILNK